MKKKQKSELCSETVKSDHFHVGIELELISPEGGDGDHDDESCNESYESQIRNDGPTSALRDDFDLTQDEARRIERYFDFDEYVSDRVSNHECDDSECSYISCNSDSVRENLRDELEELTGNASFKVDSDSSINKSSNETDAEVCWNYYASRETLKDNTKIMKLLKEKNLKFNQSCGLHVNLNNYLNLPQFASLPTSTLSFLFSFVGASRSKSHYCNANALSTSEKYSMIYHQGDRLEFRFFSPTLDAEKLNHYVALANVVYRRLAGIDARLNKKTESYFINKMIHVNEIDREEALKSIAQVNSIKDYWSYLGKVNPNERIKDAIRNQIPLMTMPIETIINELQDVRDCNAEHDDDCNCLQGDEILEREVIEETHHHV